VIDVGEIVTVSFRERVQKQGEKPTDDIINELMDFYRNSSPDEFEELRPVFRAIVYELLRERTNRIERQAFLNGPPKMRKRADEQRPRKRIVASELRGVDFRLERVSVPGYGLLTWGQMTIVHHQARIEGLMRYVEGTQRTIDRHQWAIKEIKKHKVTCLDDLDYVDVPA